MARCWRGTRLWSSLACLKPHHHQRTEDAGASGRIRRRTRTRKLDEKERRDTEKDGPRNWMLLTSLASRDSLLWGPPRKEESARINTADHSLMWRGKETGTGTGCQVEARSGYREGCRRETWGGQRDLLGGVPKWGWELPLPPHEAKGCALWCVWRLAGAKGQQGWGCLASSPRSICEAQLWSEVRVSPTKHWKRPWVPGRLLGGPSSSLPPASAHLALLLAPLQTYWHRTRLGPVKKQSGQVNRVRDERDAWRGSSPPNRTRCSPATGPGTPAPLEAGPLIHTLLQWSLPLVFPCLLSNSEDIIILLASVLQMLLPICWGCLFHLSFFFFFFLASFSGYFF